MGGYSVEALIKCRLCGKPALCFGQSDICIDCLDIEGEFQKVRDYVHDHQGAKIFEVSLALHISIDKLKRFLKEGRLEIVEKDNQFLFCESCRKPIQSGRYCDECLVTQKHDFKTVYTSKSGSKKALRFLSH